MEKDWLDPRSAQNARQSEKPADVEGNLLAENAAAMKSSNAGYVSRTRAPRKLVLCFDGTGNKFHGDDSDSNILKIFRMLDRTAGDQYHYYQPGIGTYVVSGSLSHTSLRSRLSSWYTKAKDSAIGSSFDQHVVGGYRFLMRFYNPGDEIYMFGFSRGSYIARFLAEMLDYIGLLSHGNEEMVKFAWKAFAEWQCRKEVSGSDEEKAEALAKKRKMYEFMKGFRETFSRPVGRIKFLGLFDTVNSVPRFEAAWMQRSKFPYTARSSAKVIRHAVSIDERRAKFRQDLMYQGNPRAKLHRHRHLGNFIDQFNPHSRGLHSRNGDHSKHKHAEGLAESKPEETNGAADPPEDERGRRRSQFLAPGTKRPGEKTHEQDCEFAPYRKRSTSRLRATSVGRQAAKQRRDCSADGMSEMSGISPSELDPDWDEDGQDIDEVWFAGGHGDVGGGWEMLEDRKSASHVPLAWIVREAMRAGLPLDPDKVAEMGCSCHADWDGHNPSRLNSSLKQQKKSQRQNVPNIRLQESGNGEPITPTFPDSPLQTSKEFGAPLDKEKGGCCEDDDDDDDDEEDSDDDDEKMFKDVMSKAHTSRIHDSLSYDSGLGFAAVTAWKFMEWLPFARMDLRSDGSWEPIRWPLPRGEVRDVPDNVRVHGSVIRRMEADKTYRPGNLIVGGGGRGVRHAPEEHGIGEWVCVAEKGDAIGEIWMRKNKPQVKTD
ncbi:unnamed protein product [Clonostachys chloroleuca]|uniref:T6SS Phospholipase effector Tle1-like catalytic domain-containing protein n=1 Tax=Clonostachys chloroleuca TaxID=1926264 RepID=A0AA35MDA9_9HYPO|nr:unnamed protein product [Clonostachys chloroleuca]